MQLRYSLVLSILLLAAFANTKAELLVKTGFSISGKIVGYPIINGDSLELVYIEDMVSPANFFGQKKWKVPLTSKGTFGIRIPEVRHFTWVGLIYRRAEIMLISRLILFPGDDVHVLARHGSGSWDFRLTGKGATRLNHHYVSEVVSHEEGNGSILPTFDSAVNAKWKTIEKQNLKTPTKQFLKAEMLGGLLGTLFYVMLFQDSVTRESLRTELESISQYAWFREVNEYPVAIQSKSPGWVQGLYTVNNQLLVNCKDSTYGYFDTVFKRIEATYSGSIRDRLLLHHVSNGPSNQFHNYFPGGTFESYMNRLDSLAEDKKVKEIISSMKSRLSKGSAVYPFTFYDQVGKRWTPQDLKGKFVYFDLWGPGCGACISANEAFKRKIAPFISRDSLVALSVCDSQDKEQWLHSIPKYSSSEHVNVYSPDYHEILKLRNYYSVSTNPFILLIDPEGKIYSSNPPLANRPGNDLLKEIRAAIRSFDNAK
jgi:thiol-disulfide isomerase/thioredoxin